MAYEIHWSEAYKFFNANHTKSIIDRLKDRNFVHLWNHSTENIELATSSLTAYTELAQELCPNILWLSGKYIWVILFV